MTWYGFKKFEGKYVLSVGSSLRYGTRTGAFP